MKLQQILLNAMNILVDNGNFNVTLTAVTSGRITHSQLLHSRYYVTEHKYSLAHSSTHNTSNSNTTKPPPKVRICIH